MELIDNARSEMILHAPYELKVYSYFSLALSYNIKTGLTTGYLGVLKHDDSKNIIPSIRNLLTEVVHPFFLPGLLYHTMLCRFHAMTTASKNWVGSVKQAVSEDPKHGPGKDEYNIGTMREIITKGSMITETALEWWFIETAKNLQDGLRRFPSYLSDTRMETMTQQQKDLILLMSTWNTTQQCLLNDRMWMRQIYVAQVDVVSV